MAFHRIIGTSRRCCGYLLYFAVLTLVCVMLIRYHSHFYLITRSKPLQGNHSEPSSKTQKDEGKSPLLIIIAAYMHTGSTYTGSVFQQHPGTFYDFEPLRSAVGLSRKNLPVQFVNGSFSKFHGDWIEQDGRARELVQNLLDCKYHLMDIGTMDSSFYSPTSPVHKHRKPFLECLQKRKTNARTTRIQMVLDCLPYLETPCIHAHIRVFKFIRFPLSAAGALLRDNKNLKIIHLVRDPRAMMDSQVRKNDNQSRRLSNFTVNTKRICNRLIDDLNFTKTFPSHIRRRIKLIRYEDLSDFPQNSMRSLFEFANVKYKKLDVDYVELLSRNHAYFTLHKLPAWRTHMEQPFLDVVNEYCQPIYKELGYVEYSDITDIQKTKNPASIALNDSGQISKNELILL